MTPISARLRTAAIAAGCAAALWFLGRGALTTPPVHSLDALQRWSVDTDPVTAAVATARAIGALIALHLALVSLVVDIAERRGRSTIATRAVRLLPRSMRPIVGIVATAAVGASGASLVAPRPLDDASSVVRAVDPADSPSIREVATIELVTPPTTAIATTTTTTTTSTTTSTTSSTTRPAPVTTVALPHVLAPDAFPDVGQPPASPAHAGTVALDTWTIAPGDHLWHVAAETLADHWHRAPTDREIVPYWRALIEANRDRLVDHDDPDLVHPGQVFVLPPVPAPNPLSATTSR